MKLNKLLKTLAVVVPVTGTVCVVANCGGNPSEPVSDEKPFDYIYNRTFALWGYNKDSGEGSCGTCWLLSDATPNNTTDYKYYIATNWHVKEGIDSYGTGSQIRMVYGSGTGNVKQESYLDFASFTWKSANDFCYDSGDTSRAIDFYIAEADFANANMTKDIKNKFETVNKCQKEKGYINKFYETTSDTQITGKKMYCAGYPAKSGLQQWNKETITENKTAYYPFEQAPHSIKSTTIVDISPQYPHKTGFQYDETTEQCVGWSLTPGSSGSMMIFNNNGEWNVAGIFWGGFLSQDKTYFFPSFSLFKTNSKNFVEDYEK